MKLKLKVKLRPKTRAKTKKLLGKCCFATLCQCTSLIPKLPPLLVVDHFQYASIEEDGTRKILSCEVAGAQVLFLVNALVSNPWTDSTRKGFKNFDGHVSHARFLCLLHIRVFHIYVSFPPMGMGFLPSPL